MQEGCSGLFSQGEPSKQRSSFHLDLGLQEVPASLFLQAKLGRLLSLSLPFGSVLGREEGHRMRQMIQPQGKTPKGREIPAEVGLEGQ